MMTVALAKKVRLAKPMIRQAVFLTETGMRYEKN
jgi:hypothetical protein